MTRISPPVSSKTSKNDENVFRDIELTEIFGAPQQEQHKNTGELLSLRGTPITQRSNNKAVPWHVQRLRPPPNSKSANNTENVIQDTGLNEILQSPQHKNPKLILTPELKYISRQLASIKLDLAEMKRLLKPANNFKINLPIKSKEDLDDINSKLEDEEFTLNLTKYLAPYVSVDGKHHSTGISKIISDELLKDYNWHGTNLKNTLKSIPLFNKILFDALKVKFSSHAEYEKNIKKQIFDAHNRENRRKSRLRLSIN